MKKQFRDNLHIIFSVVFLVVKYLTLGGLDIIANHVLLSERKTYKSSRNVTPYLKVLLTDIRVIILLLLVFIVWGTAMVLDIRGIILKKKGAIPLTIILITSFALFTVLAYHDLFA